jgi:predicted LPLAT superfamily acyltransferase
MWWRRAVVAAILGLWLTIGVAWGGRAALVYGFFVLVACIFGFWAVAAGSLSRRAGGGYYERQLDSHRSGRWRDRETRRRR